MKSKYITRHYNRNGKYYCSIVLKIYKDRMTSDKNKVSCQACLNKIIKNGRKNSNVIYQARKKSLDESEKTIKEINNKRMERYLKDKKR